MPTPETNEQFCARLVTRHAERIVNDLRCLAERVEQEAGQINKVGHPGIPHYARVAADVVSTVMNALPNLNMQGLIEAAVDADTARLEAKAQESGVLMDAIRTVALAAIVAVRAEYGDRSLVIRAVKVVREKTGADLRHALDAVRWALDRPPADTLPPGSIVGSEHVAWCKAGPRAWHSTDTPRVYLNVEIDAMLQAGLASILRVGTR